MAALLRAAVGHVSGRARLRGHAVGRRFAPRLHRGAARPVALHPIYVLALARPELLERRATWGAGLRNFTSLYLEPLAPAAMQDLLLGLVPGLPAALREQILARAEGIPLYAVETVRMLLDRGDLVLEGPAYRPVGEIGALEVPETLHALIAARLDGLPARSETCSRTAPSSERRSRSGHRRADGPDEAELEPLLRRSSARRCWASRPIRARPSTGSTDSSRTSCGTSPTRRSRARPQGPPPRRRAPPRGGARGDEEVAEVVASHLLDAYRLAPDADDADEIRDRPARRSCGRATGPDRSARRPRRSATSSRRRSWPETPLAAAALADRAGQMAWLRGGRRPGAVALRRRHRRIRVGRRVARGGARVGQARRGGLRRRQARRGRGPAGAGAGGARRRGRARRRPRSRPSSAAS